MFRTKYRFDPAKPYHVYITNASESNTMVSFDTKADAERYALGCIKHNTCYIVEGHMCRLKSKPQNDETA